MALCKEKKGTMMQILIVDDDLSTVECIRTSIDWDALGISTVYTAHSKAGALNILEVNEIDIVLCDIEMPLGSGIELIEEARKIGYTCDFIFLTCHDNFSFASAALTHRAASYVLKPFNPEKVTEELIKVIKHRESLQSMYESSRYGSYWLKNKEEIERNFWKDLLTKKLPPNKTAIFTEASQRGITVCSEEPLLLALFSFQYDTLPKSEVLPKEKWAADAIAFMTKDVHCHIERSRIITWWRRERLHIYYIQLSPDTAFMESLNELLKRCKESLSVVVNGYAIKKVSIEQLADAKCILEKLDYNNVGNVGQLQFIRNEQGKQNLGRKIDLSQLRTIIATGNKMRILTYLRTQLEVLAPESAMTPSMLYAAQQKIIQEVNAYLLSRGIKLEMPAADDDSYTIMSNASTSMYNMLKWLSYYINFVVDSEKAVNKKNMVVEQAKTFIDTHFSEKITQNEIAKAVYLTPGHLSKVFKRQTGVSLNQYINDRRMSMAKELLANSDIDINEVASRSGFGSSSYFITYFRKNTGKTPKEYRHDFSKCELEE